MKFSKWHGLGNDFVLIDDLNNKIADPCALGKQLCDRHFGVGADGLLLIRPSAVADFYMLIINSDGTVAEMCGNATRCFAKHLRKYGYTDKTIVSIETLAGIKTAEILPDGYVRVDLGVPNYNLGAVPMAGAADDISIGIAIEIEGRTFVVNGISMGNPHCVIFTDDADTIDLNYWGPKIENHPLFPVKTNVEFVKVIDCNNLQMRVWERGCGVTLACGTGSAATLVAAVLTGNSEKTATIHLDGGQLLLEWAENGSIFKTGAAVEVFRGELL
ncbi:MAG: diaminopimelate epimerase [Negativicutes bacterium]